jgi:predicted O-methyltransferase YrrM
MHASRAQALVKFYRKIRYRKGFGVHSPFVYNLITNVVEEKYAYYAFEEIEHFRRQLLSDNERRRTIARETQSAAYGALLFRMVHFFKCRTVIEIGSSTGMMGLYLAMASRTRCHCRLLDERPGGAKGIQPFVAEHHLDKLQYIEGDYRETIPRLYTEFPEVDLLFINRLPETITVEELFRLCRPMKGKHSILLLDDIGRKKEMHQVWQTLKQHPQSRVMVDLYVLGIVFFDERLPKRYYKAYFNDKQKQNLHKKRRQGLHLIGRRKKGAQNPSSH